MSLSKRLFTAVLVVSALGAGSAQAGTITVATFDWTTCDVDCHVFGLTLQWVGTPLPIPVLSGVLVQTDDGDLSLPDLDEFNPFQQDVLFGFPTLASISFDFDYLGSPVTLTETLSGPGSVDLRFTEPGSAPAPGPLALLGVSAVWLAFRRRRAARHR